MAYRLGAVHTRCWADSQQRGLYSKEHTLITDVDGGATDALRSDSKEMALCHRSKSVVHRRLHQPLPLDCIEMPSQCLVHIRISQH